MYLAFCMVCVCSAGFCLRVLADKGQPPSSESKSAPLITDEVAAFPPPSLRFSHVRTRRRRVSDFVVNRNVLLSAGRTFRENTFKKSVSKLKRMFLFFFVFAVQPK